MSLLRDEEDEVTRSDKKLVGLWFVAMVVAWALSSGLSVARARYGWVSEPMDWAEITTATWVRADVAFADGMRLMVISPRDRGHWPAYCRTCGGPVREASRPIEIWKDGVTPRRVWVGCFSCWKEVMHKTAQDLEDAHALEGVANAGSG